MDKKQKKHRKQSEDPKDISSQGPLEAEELILPQNPVILSRVPKLPNHNRGNSDTINHMLIQPSESRHTSPVPMYDDSPFDPNEDDSKIFQAQDIEKVELQLMQSTAGKFYRYRGPKDENLDNMLEELDQLLQPGPRPWELMKAINRRVDNWFEKKNCCNNHLGPVTLSKDTIFLLIASLTITIYICVKLQDYSSGSFNGEWFLTNSFPIVFCFTIYGMIFLSLPPKWAYGLFALQFLIPLLILLDDFGLYTGISSRPATGVIMPKLIVMGYAIIWGILYPFYRILRTEQSRFMSHCFLIGVFVVILFIFQLIFEIFGGNYTDGYSILGISYFIIILTGIMVSFSWIYIHNHYFLIPAPILESFVLKYGRKLLMKPNFSGTKKEEKPGEKMKKRIAKNLNLIASLFIGGIYIAIEMFLAVSLVKSGQEASSSSIIIFAILLVVIPLFLHLGLPLVTNLNVSAKNKMLIIPILVIIPIVVLIRVSESLTSSGTASAFSIYLITGPPVALFFWLLMVMINIYRRRAFYVIMAGACLFFWVPVYFLLPISETPLYGNDSAIKVLAFILIGIGFISIAAFLVLKLLVLVYNIFKKRIGKLRNTYRIYKLQKMRIELKKLKLKRMGSKVLDDKKEELDLIEGADGIMDLKDLYPFNEKEVKSINFDSPNGNRNLAKSPSMIVTPEERALAEEIKKLSSMITLPKKEKVIDNVQAQRDKLLQSKYKLKLKELIYLNLKNFGYWINASSFVVSYTFIVYVFFNLGDSASANEEGVITALTIVIPVIFVVLNSVIRMRSAAMPPIDTEADGFDLRFLSDKSNDDPKIKRHISKIEAIFLFFGVLIIPICQIPLYFVLTDDGAKQANLFAMITSILLSLIVAFLLEFKKRSGPFHKFFVPVIVSVCWLFFIMPYLVLFPIVSAVIQGQTTEYELFLKILVMASAFCFLLLNTSLAIILNIILQKIEEEKLIKFVVAYLKKVLKATGVRGLDIALRRLYDNYLKFGPKALTDRLLKDRRPCLMVKVPEDKRQLTYSHILWLFETYAKAIKKKNKEEDDDDEQKVTWVERCFKCCFTEDPEDPIEMMVGPEPILRNVEEEMDMGRFKVDIYMPKDIKREKDYVGGDLTFMKKKGPETMDESDKTSKDFMTNVLEQLVQVIPDQNDQDFENAKEHAKLIMHDLEEMEEWYQHVFDYFCGRASLGALDNRSNGLIFRNFQHFLRLSCLSLKINEDKALNFFIENSTKQKNEVRYLSYNEFIDILHEICITLFPSIEGKKMLKKITKLIYPPLMRSVQDIAKFYQERTRRYTQQNIIYDPHLKIFLGNTQTEEDQPLADLIVTEMYHDRNPTPIRNLNNKNMMVHPETPEPQTAEIEDKKKLNVKKIIPEKTDPHLSSFSQSHKKKEVSFVRICFRPIGLCLLWIINGCKKCTNFICRSFPMRFGIWLDIKVKKLGIFLGFDVDDAEELDDHPSAVIRIDAPPWPIIVEIMMKNIPEAEKIYFEKEKNRSIRLMFNLTNLSAIFGKILEIYGYISYAFRPEIPWFSAPDVNIEVSGWMNILNGAGLSEFRFTFWFAAGMVVLYIIFAIPAIKALRRGNLGETDDGKPAGFPHFQFFVVFIVQTFGGSLFQNIIKWLLDAFVCNFDASPWYLASDSSIECLSNTHFMYIIVGIVCLLIYYPMCTFMYPNFQFQNKLLDLKYSPAWMVIVIQVKLLLACFFTFFKSTTGQDASVTTQLVATFIILTILAVSNLYLRPCLVKKFNVWDVGLYTLAAYVIFLFIINPEVNFMSLLVYFTSESAIIGIFLLVGAILILVLTYIVQRLLYGKIVLRAKKNQVWDIGQTLQYDETKRKAEHSDLDKMRNFLNSKNNPSEHMTSEPLRTRTEDKDKEIKIHGDYTPDEELLKF